MNQLIQEAVKFSCSSLYLSQCMFNHMSEMTKNGFRDRDGKLKKLNNKGEEFAHHLIQQAKAFIDQQKKIEDIQEVGANNTIKLEHQEATDLRHDKELAHQAKTDERHDKELAHQAKTDERHDREIEQLRVKINAHEKILKKVNASGSNVKIGYNNKYIYVFLFISNILALCALYFSLS
ncbi:hypothetical protein PEPS_00880 [Persicobacter psychrovividus]|uniref:Uncharacterized protein n=2 Tax=Persicobacter psychrovividus TaxID=387638 RepID=A0ABN6L829_9BACT|nr:hypothetical protein PEPS_00880 [Persicobacter psychrovividus]